MKGKKITAILLSVLTALAMSVFTACGSSKKDTGCKHDWAAATCTTPERCTKCNKTRGKANGHSYGNEKVVDATCDDNGSTEKECSVCHDVVITVTPQLSHHYVPEVAKGDCETDTVTTYTCDLCHDAYSEITARHAGHDTANATWTVASQVREESDCKYLVTETAKCKTCKEDITRTYHKHVYMPHVVEVIPATCKEEGEIRYACECENEQYNYTETLPVNPAAHDWQPTEKAGATHECTECGKTKSEITIQGNSATLSAAQLAGENIAIKTDSNVTLSPDSSLAGKMTDGVNIAAEPVSSSELTVNDTDASAKLVDAPIYNFELKDSSNEKINFDGGKMTISVPYDLSSNEDPSSVTVMYIAENGDVEYASAIYGNGMATFTVEHFSHYAVVRLSATERCAKLGHNYSVVNVPATCDEDGYTVKSCRRCGDFVREAGAKKLGHDYKSTVVAPTCVDKGYTLMSCKRENCNESYISKYTATVAHSYTNTVVAPTCTAKGYTNHVCGVCGQSYRDSYTEMVAHKYKNGECTVCHTKSGASAADKFYVNLINSLSQVESYYIGLSDVSFDMTVLMGENRMTQSGTCDAYKLEIGLDADGYLVGNGEGKFVFNMSSNGKTNESGEQKVLLAFKNKNIYIREVETYSYNDMKYAYDETTVISQDSVNLDKIKQTIGAFYTDSAKKVVDVFLNGSGSVAFSKDIARVVEYLFDKTKSANGYTLTLNYDHLAEAVEYAEEHTSAEVIDALLGEGSFADLSKLATDLSDMSLEDLISWFTQHTSKYKLNIKDVYALIESVIKTINPNSTVNVITFVSENGSKKIPEVVELLSNGQMTKKDVADMLKGYVGQYVTLLSDDSRSFAETVYYIATGKEAGSKNELLDYIFTTLNTLIDAAKDKVSIVIGTNAAGSFEYVKVNADKFEISLDIPEMLGGREMTVRANANLSFVVTSATGAVNNNNNIVLAVDGEKASFMNIVEKNLGKTVGYRYGDNYTIVKNDGYYLLVPEYKFNEYNLRNPHEATYNNKQCVAYDLRLWGGYVLDMDGEFSYRKSCSGWTENRLSAKWLDYTHYTVYLDEKYNVLGYELNLEETLNEVTYNESAWLYVNSARGILSGEEPHSYVLVDKKEPTKCEEAGYEKYRCTVCGNIKYESDYKWHKFEYTYELKDSKLGCEGGIVEVMKCVECGKEERSEMSGTDSKGNHRTVRRSVKIGDAKCDTYLYIYGCVCGKYINDVYVDGECEFVCSYRYCETGKDGTCEHGYEYHEIQEYQCGVTACAYTYTYERIRTVPNSNCISENREVYTLKNGQKYTAVHTQTRHKTSVKETTEGKLHVDNYTCNICKKTIRVDKYDEYGRLVYQYNYEDKYGFETVYTGCNYVMYRLDENGDRAEIEDSGIRHMEHYDTAQKTSCTQPHDRTVICEVCKQNVRTISYFYGHDMHWDSEKNMYVCNDCGLTNDIYVDGPVALEDLSNSGDFIIGYLNRTSRNIIDVEFYTNYDSECMLVDYIVYDKNETSLHSGIIVIYQNSIAQWLSENAGSTFTVVLTVNGKGGWEDEKYPDQLEMSITFTAEELQAILDA